MKDTILMHAVKPQLLPLDVSGIDEFMAMFVSSVEKDNATSADKMNTHSYPSLLPD